MYFNDEELMVWYGILVVLCHNFLVSVAHFFCLGCVIIAVLFDIFGLLYVNV